MNTLDKLTIYDIGRADRFWLDGEEIDDLTLLELAIKSPDMLKNMQYTIKTNPMDEVEISIW